MTSTWVSIPASKGRLFIVFIALALAVNSVKGCPLTVLLPSFLTCKQWHFPALQAEPAAGHEVCGPLQQPDTKGDEFAIGVAEMEVFLVEKGRNAMKRTPRMQVLYFTLGPVHPENQDCFRNRGTVGGSIWSK